MEEGESLNAFPYSPGLAMALTSAIWLHILPFSDLLGTTLGTAIRLHPSKCYINNGIAGIFLQVQSQPGLYNEFQDNQGGTVRPCLKKPKQIMYLGKIVKNQTHYHM